MLSKTVKLSGSAHSLRKANNSYSLLEPKIPSVCSLLVNDPLPAEHGVRTTVQQHSCQSADLPSLLTNQNPTSSFFTKDELSSARIIGQVDQKFIACLISHPNTVSDRRLQGFDAGSEEEPAVPGTSTLVLIDQHAADERVRVESFLKELCLGFLHAYDNNVDAVHGVKLRMLSPPKPVLVTSHELRLLKESTEVQEAFQNWGIRIAGNSAPDPRTENSSTDSDNNGYGQILVEAIPEVVSDKVTFVSFRSFLPLTHAFHQNPSFCRKTSCRI